jgi:hypothetical protein
MGYSDLRSRDQGPGPSTLHDRINPHQCWPGSTDDGTYHVDTDLPGVDAARIEVTVEHNTLTIPASPKVQARRIDVTHAQAGKPATLGR